MSLQRQIEDVVADAPGIFGVYARHLGTNDIVEVDAERVMNAESAAKGVHPSLLPSARGLGRV